MASKSKRPHMANDKMTPEPSDSESDSSSLSSCGDEDESEQISTSELQLTFEARSPQDMHRDGIISVLSKKYGGVKDLNLSVMADYIIDQRSVGSVILQSPEEDMNGEGDDDDDDDDGLDTVCGLASVVRLDEGHEVRRALRRYVLELASKANRENSAAATKLVEVMTNVNNVIGLIVSERIMNMPGQISVPLFDSLFNEIRKATIKSLPFNFTHYVLISKKLHNTSSGAASAAVASSSIGKANGVVKTPSSASSGASPTADSFFANAEEEIIEEESDFVLELPFGDDGSARRFDLSGSIEYLEKTCVLVFSANKSDKLMANLRGAFPA